MRDVTELKGLGSLRTATTTHLRAKPPQEGTEYLELYLAKNEEKRLVKLMQTWEKQRNRAQERHQAVGRSIVKLEQEVGLDKMPSQGAPSKPGAGDGQAPAPDYTQRQWKRMPLDY